MWNTRDIPMVVESLLQNIHVLNEFVLMLRLKSKLLIHNGYHNHNLTKGKPTFQFHDHTHPSLVNALHFLNKPTYKTPTIECHTRLHYNNHAWHWLSNLEVGVWRVRMRLPRARVPTPKQGAC